jgi:hypothetical protein
MPCLTNLVWLVVGFIVRLLERVMSQRTECLIALVCYFRQTIAVLKLILDFRDV